MILEWFNAREAAEVAVVLADQFATRTGSSAATGDRNAANNAWSDLFDEVLQSAEPEVRRLRLNFYTKARFANSFKWRLIEKGVQRDTADEVTQRLVLHLSTNGMRPASDGGPDAAATGQQHSNNAKNLLGQAHKCFAQGAYAQAVGHLQDFLRLNPRHADALNNLGAALSGLGRYGEAQDYFRKALAIDPHLVEAQSNLGGLLRAVGQITEAEAWLRSALKLNPNHLDARYNLGLLLVFLGRLREAENQFKKVLKLAPRNSHASFGMGLIAEREGRFEEAEALFKRALAVNRKMTGAWAGLVGLRKQTASDADWLKGAEELAASALSPSEEGDLRFAMGKYWDDLGDFAQAFHSYKRGNELLKTMAPEYVRDARTLFVDNLIRTYTREKLSNAMSEGSASVKPVILTGMQRSGTSLAEQILASHPSVKGAGELTFWSRQALDNEPAIIQGMLDESTRKKLTEDYLRVLQAQSGDAPRIVDKSLINADYLGAIHSVFPQARIIYMQRDPVDTCLSCYFQKFSPGLQHAMDLEDLAHYYREHQRLMAHWRTVLPAGSMLEVPYAGLVADQEGWTRKMLSFIGLEWDDRCLEFHATRRAVTTSSSWQVRQKIYASSVQRWRHYKKFIHPLLALQ